MRVLILEDDDDFRDALLRTVEGWGYDVRGSPTGPHALVGATLWCPRVVLVEIGLPGMDGYETARRFRDLGVDWLIAVSGSYPEPPELVGVEFDAHVLKPLLAEHLRTALSFAEAEASPARM
jgi:CheY-like chemotaxis protein